MVNYSNWSNLQQSKLLRIAVSSKDIFLALVCLSFSLSILLPAQIVLAEETMLIAKSGSGDKLARSEGKKIYKPIGQKESLALQTTTHRLPLGVLLLLLKQKKNQYKHLPSRALIGPEGGTLFAFGDDDRAFQLTIPPKAILGPEVLVSIQPLEIAPGLPISGEPLVGVKLEPAGLNFNGPVTLEIRLQQPRKQSELLLAVSTSNTGDNQFFVPLILAEQGIQELSLQLNHFSGLWVGRGNPDDINNHYFPPEHINRVSQSLAEWAAHFWAENVTQQQYEGGTRSLIESYLTQQVLPFYKYTHYSCAQIREATLRTARWTGFLGVFGTVADREAGLMMIGDAIPSNAKETLNEDVADLDEKCRKDDTPSCEAEEFIRRAALCNYHANHLSTLTERDLSIDPALSGNFCPGKPAAIRTLPLRYTVCTGKSFYLMGWVEDTGGNDLSGLVFPIKYTSTNELIMSVESSNWSLKGLRPGEADLLATAGCSLEIRRPISVGVVNLVGGWEIEGTETISGCMDSDDDGTYTGSGTITIDWQHENGKGEAFLGGRISGQPFTGIVNCYGQLDGSGTYTHKDEGLCLNDDDIWVVCDVKGHDSISGLVKRSTGYRVGEGIATTIEVTTESQDDIGDKCKGEGEGVMSRGLLGGVPFL